MNADIPLPRSHGPSMAKMLVIFIVSSIGLLVVNDLVFYNLFKGSIVKGEEILNFEANSLSFKN